MRSGDDEEKDASPAPFAIQLAFPDGNTTTVNHTEYHSFTVGEGGKEYGTIAYDERKKAYALVAANNLTSTWLEVGRYVPPLHTEWPPHYVPACVLQLNATFLIGNFECQVIRCPLVRRKDAQKYWVAPTASPCYDNTSRAVAEEIEEDESAELGLRVTSRQHYMYLSASISYGRGGHFTTIGTSSRANICLPHDHLSASQLDALHCRILAIGGCFWLIDGDTQRSSSGTYIQLGGAHYMHRASPPQVVLFGDSDEPKVSFRMTPTL
jgi:hypothetical protein